MLYFHAHVPEQTYEDLCIQTFIKRMYSNTHETVHISTIMKLDGYRLQ